MRVILLFESYPVFVCSREMEKILIQWNNGRSKGMTSLVRKTAIKTGTIAVNESVRSLLRKIQEDLQCPSNQSQQWSSTSVTCCCQECTGRPVLFQCDWSSSFHCRSTCTWSTARREIFHYLTHVGQLAKEDWQFVRHTVRCWSVTGVQSSDIRRESVCSSASKRLSSATSNVNASTYHENYDTKPPYLLYSQETLQTHLESPQPLSDVATRMNETDFCIPAEDISFALQACNKRADCIETWLRGLRPRCSHHNSSSEATAEESWARKP